MVFIMLTVLIDMISIGIIAPVLPMFVGHFTQSPAEQSMAYGAVMVSFALAQFFGAPILGALSDRFGRRPVLLIGLFAVALNFFVTAIATTLAMLVVVRLIGGAMYSNIAVANAYVADITEPQDRAKNYGMLGAMFGLGFILGPVTGGLLGDINIHLPFYAAGGLALVNWLYGYFVLPESLPQDKRRGRISWASANPFSALARLAQLEGVGGLVAVIGLSSLAQFVLHSTWVLYAHFKFGWGPKDNGWSLFAVGMMAVIVQGGLLRQLHKHVRLQKLATIGLVSSTLAYAAYGLVPEGWMMYVVIAANLFGYTVNPTIQSMVSNATDARSQGRNMGAVSSINSVAAVLGPILGAPLMAKVSHLPHGDWRVGMPFYVCAALQGLATIFAVRHFANAHHHQAAVPHSAS
jgi:DHA1 family tetracycline resistance protein-like MFS transporter